MEIIRANIGEDGFYDPASGIPVGTPLDWLLAGSFALQDGKSLSSSAKKLAETFVCMEEQRKKYNVDPEERIKRIIFGKRIWPGNNQNYEVYVPINPNGLV